MDERKRLGEPPAAAGPEARQHRGEVGLVLRSVGVLGLEEQDDLRPGIRNAVIGSLDHLAVRQPDPFVAAVDPRIALARLTEDVQSPAPTRRLPYPRLLVRVECLRRLGNGQTSPGSVRSPSGMKSSYPANASAISENRSRGMAISRSSCTLRSSPRKRSIAQPAATYHGDCTSASSAATSSGRHASQRLRSGSKAPAATASSRVSGVIEPHRPSAAPPPEERRDHRPQLGPRSTPVSASRRAFRSPPTAFSHGRCPCRRARLTANRSRVGRAASVSVTGCGSRMV